MNGFMSFLDEKIVKEILSWQREDNGCFEYFEENVTDATTYKQMNKRSANRLEDNCSDHMIGLAFAFYGFLIHVIDQFS